MKKNTHLFLFLFTFFIQISYSQTIIHSENFEGADLIGYAIGNGSTNTDYATQAFATSSDNNDFFRRGLASSFPFGTPVTGNTTNMIAGENLYFTTAPVFDGHSYLRLNPITITGKTNLTIDIDVAFPNNATIRYEASKFLIVEYRLNGTGAYTQALAFYGNASTIGLFRDTNLNGIKDAGETTDVTSAMTNFSVDLNTIAGSSVIGNTIEIRVRINMPDAQEEFAFDNIILKGIDAPCTDPTVPTITASANPVCEGSSTTLTISGTLNDATQWVIYTGSCGGTPIGTTTTSSFVVTPAGPSTTYFIRGEGGCVTPGSCGTITLNVNTLDNASFNYGAASYCANGSDPTPTITGVAGGTFTSSPAGLSINATTGAIDVSDSTPATYTVTYTTAGSCPNSSSVSATINTLDNASFNYGAASYCANDSDPTPTITGVAGGTFASVPAGLSINATTGAIDVSASTPATYTVTYTTAGSCPNSSSISVTINALPTVTYTAPADLCIDTGIQTGLGGGMPSGGVYSGNGVTDDGNGLTYSFDPAAAGSGVQTITYTFTSTGGCTETANDDVTVTETAAPTVDVITVNFTGGCFGLGGVYTNNGIINGKNSYASPDSGFPIAISFDGIKWVLHTIADINDTGFENTTVPAGLNPPLTGWTPTQCIDGTLEIVIGVSLCDGATVNDLSTVSTSPNLLFYSAATGGTPLNTSDLVTTGDYYVSSTVNGCESDRTMFSVTVNPLPTAPIITSTATELCAGGAITLTSSASTGYEWSTGETTQSITVTSAGTYSCVVFNASGCVSAESNIITITDAAPIDDTISELTTGILTANETGASYQWYACPNTLLSGETNQDFEPTALGDYKVEITVGACVVESACYTVTTLDTKSFDSNVTFVIYPNPTNGLLNIDSNFDGDFIIVNQLGQTVKNFKVNATVENIINVENIADGIYYIKGSNGTQIHSQRLLIKK